MCAAVFRRSFKRKFRHIDPEESDLIDQIDVSCSPVAKAKEKYDKYETADVLDLIQESSPFKSTPQEQLIALIDESTPVKQTPCRYEQNPDIQIPSPIKSDPCAVEVIEANDSRHFQVRKEKRRRSSRKSLFSGGSGADRMLKALDEYLSRSEKERNAFFRDADDIDDKVGNESRKNVDIEILNTEFTVFGKCVVNGQIVKVAGFGEEETFEMDEQRVRLMFDEGLGNKFASRLQSGRQIRVYDPFTLIHDQHSNFVMQDFFFIKALDTVPVRTLQPKVIFKWDCPCRVTADRPAPPIRPEDCVYDQSHPLSQY